MRAIRTQIDDLAYSYSVSTATDTGNLPEMTRQEFRDETDVNKILARYGIDGLPRKPEYSEVDYDLDLQQALAAIKEAERAVEKLPPELKAKYGIWERLMAGAYNGSVEADVKTYYENKAAAEKAAATPPPTPATERTV